MTHKEKVNDAARSVAELIGNAKRILIEAEKVAESSGVLSATKISAICAKAEAAQIYFRRVEELSK